VEAALLTIDIHLGNEQPATKQIMQHCCSGDALAT
jgi:hypothetical protein